MGDGKEQGLQAIKKTDAKTYRLWGFVQVDPLLLNVNFQRWAINITMAALLAAIFTYPWFKSRGIENFKVGDISQVDVYAPDNLLIPDPETTEVKRNAAQQNAWPVYDYDPRIAKTVEKRLRDRFSRFRALYQPEWDWHDAEKRRIEILRREFHRRGVKPLQYIAEDNLPDREADAIDALYSIIEDMGVGKIELSEKQFSVFKGDRFRVETENKVLTLVLQVINEGVVFNKDQLPRETGKGITVRVLPFSKELNDTYPKADINNLHGLDDARELISDRAYVLWGHEITRSLRLAVVALSQRLIVPNYTFNKGETEAHERQAALSVETAYIQIKKGAKIVGQGEEITEGAAKILMYLQKPPEVMPLAMSLIGHFLWIATFLAIIFAFPVKTIKKFNPGVKDLVHMALLLLLLIGGLKFLKVATANLETGELLKFEYLAPLVAGAMMVRLVTNSETAVIFSVVISLFAALIVGSPSFGMYALVGSLVGASEVGHARARGALIKAGGITGMANIFLALTLALASGEFLDTHNFYNVTMAFFGGVLASFLVLGLMPVVESVFGYVTDVRLLELANQERPLLKKLVVNAPGTYQHSIMVGTLAEAAAEAIGVNPLLAKVSALYHDVGKMEKAYYYVENQRDGQNPHDKLAPSMSGLVISSHVKYGQELGRLFKLPQLIIDAIPQHHGTSLIKYFYARAKEKENPELEHIEEKDYRYEGPKPQTREIGILMLADKVEATARSMSDPTPAQLKGMVKRSINDVFNDGQLDECELTLKDLNAIAEAFTGVLTSIYHSRPEYPQTPDSERPRSAPARGGKKDDGDHKNGQKSKNSTGLEKKDSKKAGGNTVPTPL